MIKGLHHNAYRCRDSEETRRFYEDFLGLRLVNALDLSETKTGRPTHTLHTFYQLDDGSCLAFFETDDFPFEFKKQHDYDLHIALEVAPESLRTMLQRGRDAGIEDIARHLRMEPEKVRRLLRSDARLISLDAPISEGAVVGDLVADAGASSPDARLIDQDVLRQVGAAFELLNPRERRVLGLRYGLTSGREHTIQETADLLGWTREAVRQLERRAFNRLRRRRRWMRPPRTRDIAA